MLKFSPKILSLKRLVEATVPKLAQVSLCVLHLYETAHNVAAGVLHMSEQESGQSSSWKM